MKTSLKYHLYFEFYLNKLNYSTMEIIKLNQGCHNFKPLRSFMITQTSLIIY